MGTTKECGEISNKSWKQHRTKQQMYGLLTPIPKNIQVRRTRHTAPYWRKEDESISEFHLWSPTHGHASVDQPARTYIHQLCVNTGCNFEDLPEAMEDTEGWRKKERKREREKEREYESGKSELCPIFLVRRCWVNTNICSTVLKWNCKFEN